MPIALISDLLRCGGSARFGGFQLGGQKERGGRVVDRQSFKEKLQKLVEEMKQVPDIQRKELEVLTGEIGSKYEEIVTSLKSLQDTLDSLRLEVKYLLFDLDVTKRENATLRKKLEDRENNL